MGLTEEEVAEVVHLAMSVGASRLKVMADAELAAHPLAEPAAAETPAAEPPHPEPGAAETPGAVPGAEAPTPVPAFAAAPVVPDAGGG